MVSVKQNKNWWAAYDWDRAGDEWSGPWGGADAQWHASLWPRVRHYLPAGNVLEIACGYGRWTHFLKDHCDLLTAVDLAENCVVACRERFAGDERLRFAATDGRSLPDIADVSIDFAFSFDSLVHVDTATIASYLAELARVLRPDGVAFIHHSNLGGYGRRYELAGRMRKLPGALRRAGLLEYAHMRDQSVTAAFVAAEAHRAGLRCIGQEIIPWLTRRTFIDCISVMVPARSARVRPNRVVHNRDFAREAASIARAASIYAPGPREVGG